MSWGMVAVAGTSLIGAGLANRNAKKATAAANEASAAQLEFDMQRYDDWKEIYGPLQENLASYYSELTPEFYEATGVRNVNQELQDTLSAINTSIAQRGISSKSGIAQSLTAQAEISAAESRAEVRSAAPRAAAEDKTRFLQIGLGQNPAQSVSNTLAQRSSTMQNVALMQQQAAGKAIGSTLSTIGTGLSDYFNPTSVGGM